MQQLDEVWKNHAANYLADSTEQEIKKHKVSFYCGALFIIESLLIIEGCPGDHEKESMNLIASIASELEKFTADIMDEILKKE